MDWAKQTFNIHRVADKVLGKKLKDLNAYYKDAKLRRTLKGELVTPLLQAHKEKKKILLIAHSMGTIIAYDVLRELEKTNPEVSVAHWITIGSPLGLPHVVLKNSADHGDPRTPANVKKWTNFADRFDPVALDSHLSDDYGPNAQKIRVKDDLVINNYKGKTKKPNHHKSYGYLRAPEVSDAIKKFI